MLKILKCTGWIFWLLPGIALAAPLSQLTEPYANYARVVTRDPRSVAEQLENQALPIHAPDVSQSQYHLILSQAYYNLTYPQKSLTHADAALSYVSEKNQPWLYYTCLIMQANALELSGKPVQGLAAINAAVTWAQQQNDKKLLLQALFSRGIIQTGLADYMAALDDFQSAYSLAGDDPDELSKAHIAAMLAQVYEYRHEDNLSIPYFNEAVAAHRQFNAKLDLSMALFGLGKANRNIGQLELARQQLQESAELAEQVQDIQGIAYALKELASFDVDQQDYAEAESKLQKAATIFAQADNQQMNFNLMVALAQLAMTTGDLSKAQGYVQGAKDLLDRQNMPLHSITFDEMQAALLFRQQDYQAAYLQLKQAFENHKKYQNSQSTEQLHQLRSRYEVQLAQQQNERLKQQNTVQQWQLDSQRSQNIQLVLLSVFATLACGLMGLMIYRNKAHKQKLEKLATRDELTGLYNRRQTLSVLEQQMIQASRHNKGLCIAMLDLDWFKQINDSYGHLAGDNVLRAFAQVCKQSLRESDVVGRIGGEEFLLILNHSSCDDAYKVLDGLRLKMLNLGQLAGIPKARITISAGIAAYQLNDSLKDLMLLADTALYRAKNNGRNQVVLCDRS